MITGEKNFRGWKMAIQEFIIKRNDLQPYYRGVVKEYNDSGVKIVKDISGATIRCTMKSPQGTVRIDRQSCVITDSTAGEFEYRWSSGDTTSTGKYFIEFEVTPGSGGKFTVPPDNKGAVVHIKEDLDNQ